MTRKLLLAGESWVSSATHYKGFDQFGSVTFHLGAEPFVAALEAEGFAVTYMPRYARRTRGSDISVSYEPSSTTRPVSRT